MPSPPKRPDPSTRLAFKVGEVADLFGCDRRTIYRWLQSGLLWEVPIPGGKRLVDARSVENLRNGKVQAKRPKLVKKK